MTNKKLKQEWLMIIESIIVFSNQLIKILSLRAIAAFINLLSNQQIISSSAFIKQYTSNYKWLD